MPPSEISVGCARLTSRVPLGQPLRRRCQQHPHPGVYAGRISSPYSPPKPLCQEETAMRRYVAGLCTVGLFGAAATSTAAPVAASSMDVPAATAAACTPGTWLHEPANVLSSQGSGTLYAAAVASSTLAWGVGFYQASRSSGSLIEKWTGGSSWSVVGTGGKNAQLYDVAAFGVNSAFAVGFILVSGVDKPQVSHWHGSTWSRTVLPD